MRRRHKLISVGEFFLREPAMVVRVWRGISVLSGANSCGKQFKVDKWSKAPPKEAHGKVPKDTDLVFHLPKSYFKSRMSLIKFRQRISSSDR